MVFAANQVFVGKHDRIGDFIVPSRMRFPSRQKEVPLYVEWFRQHGFKVIDLDLTGEYLEGHGDLLWHPDHSCIWAGYGFRSTRGGVETFAAGMQELGFPILALELVDAYCYHLDTCLCPLSADATILYPAALSPSARRQVMDRFKRVHELNWEEALQFVANGISVNGRFVTSRLTTNLERILVEEELTPVVVETSEFEKSGGSVFCMKNLIE